MSLASELKNILTDFGKQLITDTQASLEAKLNAKASAKGSKRSSKARLGAQIKYEFPVKPNRFEFNLTMPNYWRFVDGGRNAGNVAESADITRWAQRSGVVESFRKKDLETRLAKQSKNKKKTLTKIAFDKASKQIDFLVRRKLKREGYEGNNFFKDVINDGRLKDLEKLVSERINKDILIELK